MSFFEILYYYKANPEANPFILNLDTPFSNSSSESLANSKYRRPDNCDTKFAAIEEFTYYVLIITYKTNKRRSISQ